MTTAGDGDGVKDVTVSKLSSWHVSVSVCSLLTFSFACLYVMRMFSRDDGIREESVVCVRLPRVILS